MKRIVLAALVVVTVGPSGCGLAAAPCRIASAGLKIVPVVGHVATVPTDACAEVIDPWMKRPLAFFLASSAWAATHSVFAMPLTVPQIQTASTQTTRYDCKDGKSVSVQYTNTRNHQSFAALTVDGRKLLFVHVVSGSGAHYVADQYTWWTKGPQANLYDEMAAKDSPPLLAACQACAK